MVSFHQGIMWHTPDNNFTLSADELNLQCVSENCIFYDYYYTFQGLMRSQKTANIKYQARLRTYYSDYMRFCGDQSFINIKKTPSHAKNGNAPTRVYFGINDKFTVCVTCAHILPIHNIQTNIDTSKLGSHYGDVIMSTMAYQITSLSIVYSTVYSGADQESVKAPRQWPLCGEFSGDRWIPRTNGQ